MSGWIKIHRKFNEWEWRNSPKHVAVFLDLLLNANHKEKRYRGVSIKAGQLTTSYQAISDRTGVTIRGVRTVLKDLISTHEVTHEGRRHYSIITIVNWDKYQIDDTQNDIVTTSRRQPNDNLVTTNKNEKNVKNVKNNTSLLLSSFNKTIFTYYIDIVATPNNLPAPNFFLSPVDVEKIKISSGHPSLQCDDDWIDYFKKINSSKFLTTIKKPRLDFSWCVDPENVQKVFNGRFDFFEEPLETEAEKLERMRRQYEN